MQLLVESPQHDAHAAVADHFQDLVMAQAAERVGLVGRGQESQDFAVLVVRRCFPLRLGRLVWGGEFLGQALGGGLD